MDVAKSLIIFGASARAAAFSALRAGFQPWCADLFADADLRQRAPAMKLPGEYPDGFADLVGVELPGPWIYTSGLENRPFLVGAMARRRPLWGNNEASLLDARSPIKIADVLRLAKLPGPAVWGPGEAFRSAPGRRWLIKPLNGSGGFGIRLLDSGKTAEDDRSMHCYLQEYLEGESRSAIYLGDGRTCRFLGLTRQLTGEDWLNAATFHYCGSIGPLPLLREEREKLAKLGDVLTAGCGLRGLFGVDGIWRRGALCPVEINPRYTASVEVLEYATKLSTVALHARVFTTESLPNVEESNSIGVVGKAVVFARKTFRFPATGPWLSVLLKPNPVTEMPAFADLPMAGTTIGVGHPVLTVFARGSDAQSCESALREIAAELDAVLYRD